MCVLLPTPHPHTACPCLSCGQMLASGTSSVASQEADADADQPAARGISRASSSARNTGRRRNTVSNVVAAKGVASRISTHLSSTRNKVCTRMTCGGIIQRERVVIVRIPPVVRVSALHAPLAQCPHLLPACTTHSSFFCLPHAPLT